MHSTRSRTSLPLLGLALAWPAWVQPLAPRRAITGARDWHNA